MLIRHDCRTKMVNGEKVKLPEVEQPMITLQPTIDIKDRWLIGVCPSCKRQVIQQQETGNGEAKNSQ